MQETQTQFVTVAVKKNISVTLRCKPKPEWISGAAQQRAAKSRPRRCMKFKDVFSSREMITH